MFPKLISFNGFFIPTYGFLVLIGIIFSLLIGKKIAKKEGLDPNKIIDMAISIIIFSFIGSKIFLIFTDFSYLKSLKNFIWLLRSGGVFFGGLIAGVLTAFYYLKKYNLPLWKVSDIFGIGIPFAHFFGRIGCFSAGCCWGKPCSLPWGVVFKNEFSGEYMGVPLNVKIHPTQLYEAFFLFFLFLFLFFYLYKKRKFYGQIFLSYIILYSFFRFFIEFLRDDPRGYFLIFSTSQWISIFAFFTSIFFYARKNKENIS